MITASVVLYNTPADRVDDLISCYAPDAGKKLFLIDNSESINLYCKSLENKHIFYIFNNKNLGYGAGHNIGIKRAAALNSDYHLILNPDIKFETGIIDELTKYADSNEDVNYILPKVLYPDGEIQYLCKLLPTPFDLIIRRFIPKNKILNGINDKYVLKKSGYEKIMNPPCLSGCFMFLRTDVLKKNRIFFDERFFMYCEDFDLIRRLHRIGRTIYYPEATIIHDHKRESYKSKKMMMIHIRSAILYFNKYGWFFDPERKRMNLEILREIDSLK